MNENDRYHREFSLPTYYPPLPNTQGGTRPDIPALWGRAKEMLARALTQLPALRSIAQRFWMTRREHREYREWIAPVEKLVRTCIVTKAITFLLMTPEGRKLLRDTPKSDAPPVPEKREQPAAHKISIPHPGWHSIAKLWQPQEQQQQEQQQHEQLQEAPFDPLDPAGWRTSFRVTRFTGAPEDKSKRAFDSERRLLTIDPDAILQPHSAARNSNNNSFPCLSLARRIEALQRTLADPQAAILRTARFLARFTAEAIGVFDVGLIDPRWLHGSRENFQARSHLLRASLILSRALQPRPG